MKEWWRLVVPFRVRLQGVELGENVRFYGMPIISMVNGSHIRIGDRVVLCSDSRFTALGVNHSVVLRTLSSNAQIVIGSDCGISGGAICASINVELGSECLLGANVTITDTDFHSINPERRRFNNDSQAILSTPVKIQNNVFIGNGSVILKGVTVGENSVVGAFSVVTKNIPSNSISAGNPAKLIRSL